MHACEVKRVSRWKNKRALQISHLLSSEANVIVGIVIARDEHEERSADALELMVI